MDVVDKSEFYVLNEDGDIRLETKVFQDVDDIVRHNAAMAAASNGFSDGRTLRQVASLSQVDYLNALKMGFGLDNPDPAIVKIELHKYLRLYGKDLGNQTVREILTPGGCPNIIIK